MEHVLHVAEPAACRIRRVTEAEAAQFDREGWFVVDRLVDDPRLAAVTEEIDRREAKVEAFLRTQPDERHVDRRSRRAHGVDPSRRPLAVLRDLALLARR